MYPYIKVSAAPRLKIHNGSERKLVLGSYASTFCSVISFLILAISHPPHSSHLIISLVMRMVQSSFEYNEEEEQEYLC